AETGPGPAGDDFDVWSDVLRRRPSERTRLTGHPSAAGERTAPVNPYFDPEDDEEDFTGILVDRRRRRRAGSRRMRKGTPPKSVSPLRPVSSGSEGPAGPKGLGP